ncbi:glutaredoxin family protein [Vreelandella arcis]|uniref:Glutaredoxin-like domain n=1 Tax=Vreelandella arcis TaxID=416873 RepID=A0A1H0CP03_9GAMM|nr:glutaredoxin family protein [Halomonas arcis]SDN59602.1 Glutaredoxin-like domain [Halomonas arcis]
MIWLTIYTTQGCHLCDELEARVAALTHPVIEWQRVEVSDDEALMARYGERIPVLADDKGQELDRGNELERLTTWLRQRGWLDEAALSALSAPVETSARGGAHQRNGRRFLG